MKSGRFWKNSRSSVRERASRIGDSHRTEGNTMNKIIQELNGERAQRKFPDFNPGDTVVVQVQGRGG